jgi:hypothetical protein
MVKKIDIKSTLKKNEGQNPPLSIEHVEEMTQQIHSKKDAITAENSDTETPISTVEKTKRGGKLQAVANDERQIRVSVDLPESIFIKLKILVIQEKTDLKNYIRQLVEREIG